MKPHTLACIYLAATGLATAANPTLITFDDLSVPGLSVLIPNGYSGLQWQNFGCLNTATMLRLYGTNGYVNGVVSPNNVAANPNGNPASFWLSTGETFDLDSAYLSGAWNDGLHIEVQGLVGNTVAYDMTYRVDSTAPSLIDFNYKGITSVQFMSSGGTLYNYPNGGHGEQFVLDNLTIRVVPEPSTLTFAGPAGVALMIRRRLK
jgi:hypothetical protein